ncbi:MAG TPA: hypothetical protein VMM15_14955 [Bradyrhizobium sp.]|nr:hypothetical protein [Bradyrhizobium sp.]
MTHMQGFETSTWLMQAREFLVEARRLKPGVERNELREIAAVLRELARLEADADSESEPDVDRRQRT